MAEEKARQMPPMGGPGRRGGMVGKPDVKINKETVKRLFSYFGKYKIHLVFVMFFIILSAVASVASSLFLKTLIDSYIAPMLFPNASVTFTDLFGALCKIGCLYLCGELCCCFFALAQCVDSGSKFVCQFVFVEFFACLSLCESYLAVACAADGCIYCRYVNCFCKVSNFAAYGSFVYAEGESKYFFFCACFSAESIVVLFCFEESSFDIGVEFEVFVCKGVLGLVNNNSYGEILYEGVDFCLSKLTCLLVGFVAYSRGAEENAIGEDVSIFVNFGNFGCGGCGVVFYIFLCCGTATRKNESKKDYTEAHHKRSDYDAHAALIQFYFKTVFRFHY